MRHIRYWLCNCKTDNRSVTWLLISGYFFLCVLCFALLQIPLVQNEDISLVDHIFFTLSIVSTTGLAPADFTATYNIWGQIMSLFFIQLGGIGYMALSSFIILKDYVRLPKISVQLLRMEFNLPQRYPLAQFIYAIFVFTVLIEALGAVILYMGFSQAGIESPLWQAIFHSISAFCTAGFSLFNDSMTSFQDNDLIRWTILILSLLGSIGFIVLLDFWNKLRQKRRSITLTSKIILIGTFSIWIIAAFFLFISDPNLYAKGWEGVQLAVFQSISAHTTVGFNSYPLGELSLPAIFILINIMVVGASPAGTGGGIKTTSLTAIFAVLHAILRRKKRVTFLSREIPASNIHLAISTLVFYLLLMVVGSWLVLLYDSQRFGLAEILFEVASALSTVGLSTGITSEFSAGSKIILSMLMFIGRLGVLTFGFALISRAPLLRAKPKVEDIAV